MATFQKRGTVWRASVYRHGQRRSGSFDTRLEAMIWAAATETKLVADAKEKPQAAPTPVANAHDTVASLFTRYGRDVSPTKGGKQWETRRLRTWPATCKLFSGPVTDLDAPAVADWRDARLLSVKSSTVNRELNLLSAVINTAIREWRVPGLTVNPVRSIRRPRNPAPRTRRVSASDRNEIIEKLGWDGVSQPVTPCQWTAWAFHLALETAMRRGEILGLTWQHVHLDRRTIHLPTTKNGYARDVPLSRAAMRLMGLLQRGKPGEQVAGVTYVNFGKAFSRAKEAAGLLDLRFHDSRREATTVFAGKLDSVLELAAITGHRSLDTLRKVYYQPDAALLAAKLD